MFGAEQPEYAHVPLVMDHEGERLAKRHASISLRGLREAGVKPRAIIGWLAKWSGLHESAGLCSPADLLPGFSFSNIRKEPDLLPPNMAEVLKSLSG